MPSKGLQKAVSIGPDSDKRSLMRSEGDMNYTPDYN